MLGITLMLDKHWHISLSPLRRQIIKKFEIFIFYFIWDLKDYVLITIVLNLNFVFYLNS